MCRGADSEMNRTPLFLMGSDLTAGLARRLRAACLPHQKCGKESGNRTKACIVLPWSTLVPLNLIGRNIWTVVTSARIDFSQG